MIKFLRSSFCDDVKYLFWVVYQETDQVEHLEFSHYHKLSNNSYGHQP